MSDLHRYRLVTDYGFGDKTWLERDLTFEEAVDALAKERPGCREYIKCHDDIVWMDKSGIYYLEEDHPDDVEDWNWEDS